MKYWTPESWIASGTTAQRELTATLNPLAWALEYRPKILLPGKGLIPYHPWEFQQEFLSDRSQLKAINKPRQCGISTTEAVEVAWEFDNKPGSQIVIISKDKDAAINFHSYVYQILRSVRQTNKKAPKLLKTNTRETTNDIGSRIVSLASSKESGRSFSASHLVFDELAFIEYAEEIWQAANATLSQTNGRVTGISTPKGRANLFARIFETKGHLGFKIFKYAWWDVPTYNPYYKQYKKAKIANKKADIKHWIEKAKTGTWYKTNRPRYTDLAWRQEFEGAFDANEGTVFSTRQLEKAFHRNYLTRQEDEQGIFDIWWTSKRQENHNYFTGIDLGRKNDATVLITYDYTHYPARVVDFKYIEAGSANWSMLERSILKHLMFWDGEAKHDATGVGDALSDSLYPYSEPFVFAKNKKQDLVERAQHAFDKGQVRIPKIDPLFSEHQKYLWDDKDIVQDTVMANALAISGFYEPEESDNILVDSSINFVELV